jgi:hypothetical protein
VAGFLGKGYELVQAEPDTIQWFGAKYDDLTPPTFLILDTFRAEEGRGAHLTGKVAEALLANADALLAAGPVIGKAVVLANNVRDTSAGIKNGLRVLLEAKPEAVEAVREFLTVRCVVLLIFWVGVEPVLAMRRVRSPLSRTSRRRWCGTRSSSRGPTSLRSSTSSRTTRGGPRT